MDARELCFAPAWRMAALVRRQEVTAEALTEAVIARFEKINPQVNAICTPTLESARERARAIDAALVAGEDPGPLAGVPATIKDLAVTAGVRTTFGSKLHEHWVPDADEVMVARLKAAGVVVLGKTLTPEFGHVSVGENRIFGRAKNPWDLDLNPGGSSSGAGIACACGFSPLAQGSDGGGSIRIPASFCGVFGIKPTYGRVPHYPLATMGFAGLSVQGPLTRYVQDAALMLDVMKGPHPLDPAALPVETGARASYFAALQEELPGKLKVAFWPNLGFARAVDPEVADAVARGVDQFTRLDWEVTEITRKLGVRNPEALFMYLVPATLAYDYGAKLRKWRDQFSPSFVKFIEAGKGLGSRDFLKARHGCRKLFVEFQRLLTEYDLLVTPTLAALPFEASLEHTFPAQIAGKNVSPIGWMPFTYPFNMTGHPAASVPCGFSKAHLPIGMQLVGPYRDDLRVLQAARGFEEVAPWQDHVPPVARL